MKVLIVTQYFWPEEFRINDLVADFARRGHDVTVLTGMPNYPSGHLFQGYGLNGPWEECYQGARVVRIPLIPRGVAHPWMLFLNYLSFAVAGCVLGSLRVRDQFDVVFVFAPSPITVALPAITLAKRHAVPLVLWVLDLWPESLTAAGGIRNPIVLGGVGALVRYIYRRCDLILVQSRGFVHRVQGMGADATRIRYFPSWAESLYSDGTQQSSVGFGVYLPEGFVVMFAGNLGAAQGLDVVIDAAQELRDHSDIHWVLLGDGRMRDRLLTEVTARGLTGTVHFIGRRPLQEMPWFFSRADALLVTLRKDEIFALTIPGKLQSYLASGRPILAALDGEGARIVEEAKAGIACPAEDAKALASAVLRLYSMPRDERERMGMSGRAYYESNFRREMLLDRLDTWLRELVACTNDRKP